MMDPPQAEVVVGEKKKRKRLKKLCFQIRQQMEFYFSDANLTKDRFLKKEIDRTTDGYVSLESFLQFNRIKALTTDVSLIVKALSSSQLLKVDDGGTKVKRTKPLADQKDVDDRTIYVECLPEGVDHEWVKAMFGVYGTVVYVSLPRYRTSGDRKGFAFVEFSSQEEAQKACQNLNDPPPDAPDKPGRFPKTSKQLKQLQKNVAQKSETGGDMPQKVGSKKAKRRRRNTSESSSGDGPCEDGATPVKRARNTDNESEEVRVSACSDKENRKASTSSVSDVETGTDKTSGTDDKHLSTKNEDKVPKKRKLAEDDPSDRCSHPEKDSATDTCAKKIKLVESDESGSTSKEETESSLKGKRKSETGEALVPKKVRISEKVEVEEVRKSEKRNRRRKKKQQPRTNTRETPHLRVIPKVEWLKLRDEYLSLQKASMKQLKKSLKHNTESKGDGGKAKVIKEMKYQPGVIVKVTSSQVTNRDELKAAANSVAEVAYVDLKDGETDGFIRCHNAESAAKIAASSHHQFAFSLLQDQEEKSYWDKIIEDREKKFTTKTKSKKRGAQKIIDRAEKAAAEVSQKKHVIFDD